MAVRGVALLVLLACGIQVNAHHSIGMIEISQPRWVKGTIVRFQVLDPHVMIELEESQPGKPARRWIVEGPRPARYERVLQQAGLTTGQPFLHVGEALSVCGFPLKREYAPEKMYPDWQPPDGRFIHGQILTLPGARMVAWGPYGKADNCVRAGDPPKSWVQFLNRDPLAHQLWCTGKAYKKVAAGYASAVIDEIDRQLTAGCK